jgi:hypothetical protein
MHLETLLKSRANGLHWTLMFHHTEPHAKYPGRIPAPRAGILKRLTALNAQTTDSLDTLASSLRAAPLLDELSPEECYMLRQRMRCALDILERLCDSQPAPAWLSKDGIAIEPEDRWLLAGLWQEFGTFYLQNLAWRISRGLPE